MTKGRLSGQDIWAVGELEVQVGASSIAGVAEPTQDLAHRDPVSRPGQRILPGCKWA